MRLRGWVREGGGVPGDGGFGTEPVEELRAADWVVGSLEGVEVTAWLAGLELRFPTS